VDGRGLRMLRDAGVRVTHADGSVAKEAAELVSSFAKHIRTGLPLVTLKLAASLDGKVAARDGSSKWITGEPARQDVHRLRAGSDAIVVGAGTALADGPSLTVRLEGYRGRQPLRVLVDGSGRVPATRSLFDSSAPTLVATTRAAPPAVREAWESAGAEVVVVDDAAPKVALARLFEALGKRNLQCVLLEGGPSLAWSALEEDVVDRFVLYVAPKLIGGGEAPSVLGGAGVGTIAEAVPLRIRSVERIGEDLKVVADVHRNH
jgi:diaminohydroxyphosphoribosylaminopyrimidine deaminase/5-amino-6-(5-phosphoribosylamino)uracil reductase